MNYPRYDNYKLSGIEWLGEIPSDWDLKQLKYISSCNDESLPETTDPDFPINYVDISSVDLTEGIQHIEALKFEKSPSRARRIVRDGDTIVSTVRTYLKAIAAIEAPVENLIVSTGFAVIRPTDQIHPKYLGYFIQSNVFIGEVVSRSTGVSYPAINPTSLVSIDVALPKFPDQKAIADFLDEKTAQVDRLIEKKEKLLELLAEKRTALITQAVTKGLDPTAPMKPSGIEWLGDVSEGWTITKLKFISAINGRIGFRGYTAEDLVDENEGALSLGGANTSDTGELSLKRRTYLSWEKYYESPEIMVKRGDLIIGQRGSCGQVAYISDDIGPATINPSLVLLNNLSVDGMFLKYFLVGKYSQSSFELFQSNTAVPMITQEQFNNLIVFIPPEKEAAQITIFLEENSQKINSAHATIRKAISKLKEYRSALITNAVTGKIKVT